jgi:hypothetical protein
MICILNFIDFEVINMQQTTMKEASQHLVELIEAALKGEEIIIMKGNQSAVKLIPVLPVISLVVQKEW